MIFKLKTLVCTGPKLRLSLVKGRCVTNGYKRSFKVIARAIKGHAVAFNVYNMKSWGLRAISYQPSRNLRGEHGNVYRLNPNFLYYVL